MRASKVAAKNYFGLHEKENIQIVIFCNNLLHKMYRSEPCVSMIECQICEIATRDMYCSK